MRLRAAAAGPGADTAVLCRLGRRIGPRRARPGHVGFQRVGTVCHVVDRPEIGCGSAGLEAGFPFVLRLFRPPPSPTRRVGTVRLWIVDTVLPPPLLAASSAVVAAMAEEGAGARRTCAATFPYTPTPPSGRTRLAPAAAGRRPVVRRPARADRPVRRYAWAVGRAGPPGTRRGHGIGLVGGDERCDAPWAAPTPRERALRPGRGRPADGPGRSPSPRRRSGDPARR